MSVTIENNTLVQLLTRRGTDATRKLLTLSQGELGFTTDTQRLFIGDGLTQGGIPVASKFLSNSVSINSLSSVAQVGDFTFDPYLNNTYLFTSSGFQVAGSGIQGGAGFSVTSGQLNLNSSIWSISGTRVNFTNLLVGNTIQGASLSANSTTSMLSCNGKLIIRATGTSPIVTPNDFSVFIDGSTFVNGQLSATSGNINFNNTGVTTASALSSFTSVYSTTPNLNIQSSNRSSNIYQPFVNIQYNLTNGPWNTGLYITAQPFVGIGCSDVFLQSIGTNTSNINFAVSGNSLFTNNIQVSGDVIANFTASDATLKRDIKPIENALSLLNQINGVEFEWNNNSHYSGRTVGVIAQEIEKIIPDAVKIRSDGYKGVDYIKIIPILLQAVKELSTRLDNK